MDEELTGIEPSELLDHAEFLRGLIRNLVFDEQTGEDVLQETWLTALRRPPANRLALRSWLATVARNFALKARRSTLSRQQRERRVGQGRGREEAPAADSVVSHRAVLRDMTTAVTGLKEEHQEVVYLRFYDQLPPRRIAERLGLPVETVRSRLRRALEQLRGRLQARHGKEWQALLIPFLPPGLLETAIRPRTLPVGGALAGSGLLLAGAITALLLTAPWAGEGDDPVGRGGGVESARAAAAGEPEEGEEGANPAGPSRRGRPLFTFTGRVIDERGDPVAGARVNGHHRFPLDPRLARACSYRLSGSNPDRVLARAGREPLFPGRIMAADLAAAAAPPGPAPCRTVTDGTGRFAIETPWRRPWLWAQREMLLCPAAIRGRRLEENTLVLLPGGGVTVAAQGEDGGPLVGARVRLLPLHRTYMAACLDYPVAPLQEGRTGPDGEVSFTGLVPGESWLALLQASGRGPALSAAYRARRGECGRITLRARPTRSLIVVARDGSGRPLGGVRVRTALLAFPPPVQALLTGLEGVTDGEGRLHLADLPPARLHLDAYALNRKPVQRTLDLARPRREPVELVLEEGVAVTGRVMLRDGGPAPDAVVGLLLPRFTSERPMADQIPHHLLDPAAVVRTDGEGRFRLGGLPDRPLELAAMTSAFSIQIVPVPAPREAGELLFRLERRGAITGALVDPAGRPAPRFAIQVWRNDPGRQDIFFYHRRFEAAGGSFRLPDLAPGTYDLVAEAEGYARAVRENIRVDPGRETRAEPVLRLQLPGRVEGIVQDRRGRPVPGLRLELTPSSRGAAPGTFLSPHLALSGADGRFSFTDVPPGWWEIRGEEDPRGWARLATPFRMTENKTLRDLEVRLHPPAVLSGEVYDGEGRTDAGRAVLARGLGPGMKELWSVTDGDGRFRLPNLQPGLWQVLAVSPDLYETNRRRRLEVRATGRLTAGLMTGGCRVVNVQVLPGREKRVLLGSPAGGSCSLSGALRAGSAPLVAMAVVLEHPARNGVVRSPLTAQTDPRGRYRIDRITPGEYQLVAQCESRGNTQYLRPLRFAPGAELRVDVEFGELAVRGTLLLSPGIEDLEGHQVLVVSADHSGAWYRSCAGSDGQGRFRAGPLPPGEYRALVVPKTRAPGSPLAWSRPFTLAADLPAADLRLTLLPSATLAGKAPGERWRGARVTVTAPAWPKAYQGQVGAEGSFRIDGLPPRRGTVTITATDGTRQRRETTLEPGRVNRIDFW